MAVSFPYEKQYLDGIKAIPDRRWHADQKCWSIPRSHAALQKLLDAFRSVNIGIDPALVQYLHEPERPHSESYTRKGGQSDMPDVERLKRELRLRNYSPKTIKSYVSCIRSFTAYFSPRAPLSLAEQDIRDYLLFLIEKQNFAAGSVNQVLNALRFLYVEVYHAPLVLGEIPRPKKERKLPVVLGQAEVKRIFDAIKNPKHRVMLMLVYSSGLRVSEVVQLRLEDIDGERKMVHIRGAKGKKDRYTILSDVVLDALRFYWNAYHPREWLFEGQGDGKKYSIRSAQSV